MNLNRKMKELFNAQNVNESALAKEWGFSRSYVNALKNRASIGMKVIKHLVKSFPNLNLNWLLKDEGKMFIDDQPEPKNDLAELKDEIIKDLRERVNELNRYIKRLENDLKEH